MKKIALSFVILIASFQLSQAQEWMTSLDVAKRLAAVQNKMIFMIWEDAATMPFPIKVVNNNGRIIFVKDMFDNESINGLIWEHFIPVLVSESSYVALYDQIKGERSQRYIDKFNDDTIKIMDVNGNILNLDPMYEEHLNMTSFIMKYYLDTSFLEFELMNYSQEQNFVTSLRLAAKYIDAAVIVNDEVRAEVIELSSIYLKEADNFLLEENLENKLALQQKSDLLKLLQDLVLDNPKRVLRKLKRIESSEIDPSNESLVALLYFAAYRSIKDENSASAWRNKLSLVNLKKATQIIDNNL